MFGGKYTKKELKKTELKILGVTCASCASTIEKSLSHLSGVTKAQVNLGTETASIEYDPTKLKLPELNKAVTAVGVARPRAQGQAITRTEIKAVIEKRRVFPRTKYHTIKERTAIVNTV